MLKKFIIALSLFLIPCVIVVVWYIVDDPFMMYRSYDNPAGQNGRKRCVNDAFRAIRLMDKYDDSLHYNSFILGSSRAEFYYVDDWKNYLGPTASCFHFDQPADNLLGTLQRVQYLYRRFKRVDNLLLIMDADYLSSIQENKTHLHRQPWQVTSKWDFFEFNAEFFRVFYSIPYQKQIWRHNNTTNELESYYIPEFNELHKSGAEEALKTNPDEFWSNLPWSFRLYDRDSVEHIHQPVIFKGQYDILVELKDLMQKGHTDYRIIISPLYDQYKLNPQDLEILKNIFGEDKVFDFSGKNEFTDNHDNYYENSHYRPQLTRQLLKICYDGL